MSSQGNSSALVLNWLFMRGATTFSVIELSLMAKCRGAFLSGHGLADHYAKWHFADDRESQQRNLKVVWPRSFSLSVPDFDYRHQVLNQVDTAFLRQFLIWTKISIGESRHIVQISGNLVALIHQLLLGLKMPNDRLLAVTLIKLGVGISASKKWFGL